MTLKDQYENLINALAEALGLYPEKISENVVDMMYAEDVSMCRLLLLEEADIIAIAFHVETQKTDAFQIFNVAKTVANNLGVAEDYYVDNNNLTFTGPDAYAQLFNDISSSAQDAIIEKEYEPIVPVIYKSPYAVYSASHPEAAKEKENNKERLKYYKKF